MLTGEPFYRPVGSTPPAPAKPCTGCMGKEEWPYTEIVVTADGIGDHLLGLTAAAGLVRDDPETPVRYVAKHAKCLPWLALFDAGPGCELAARPAANAARTLKPHDTYNRQMKERTSERRDWYYARACDTTPKLPTPRPLPPAAVEWAARFQGAVVISPWTAWRAKGSTRDVREWPVANWLTLESLLIDAGYRTVIIDAEAARNAQFQGTKVIGETPARIAALMTAARVTVGNDSGMIHLAGMLRRPAIALCAMIRGESVFGLYPSVRVIDGPLHCTGCHWNSGLRARVNCDGMVCASLAAITPAAVLQSVHDTRTWTPGRNLPMFPGDKLSSLFAERDRAECADWLPRYAKLWEVVSRLAPRRIVEIGTRGGYSAWTMLDAAPAAVVLGYDADIDPKTDDSHGGYREAWRHAVAINDPQRFFLTIVDSHMIQRLPACDLLYIDGDHTRGGCFADLILGQLSQATAILCDDYATANLGVKAAIDQFMSERPDLVGTFIDNGSTGLYLIERRAA